MRQNRTFIVWQFRIKLIFSTGIKVSIDWRKRPVKKKIALCIWTVNNISYGDEDKIRCPGLALHTMPTVSLLCAFSKIKFNVLLVTQLMSYCAWIRPVRVEVSYKIETLLYFQGSDGTTHYNNKSFSQSLNNTRIAILPTLFWPCNSKLKRPIKYATLKGNLFYQLTFYFTFTNILRYK